MFEKVIDVIKKGTAWSKEVATGNDGRGSASRVVALIVTPATVGVLIAHVYMNHSLPSADQLYGLATIIGTGCGAFAIGKFRGIDDDSIPSQSQGGH